MDIGNILAIFLTWSPKPDNHSYYWEVSYTVISNCENNLGQNYMAL